ncbi:hypothetical protein DL93DRAFT_2070437 [Clavulina sp. PMI_390]|nr:hypothetical protein DL93DRAFT_2070437 [Clavulina sp. PMI_390]
MDDDEMYDDLRSNEHVAVTTARILDTRRIIHARPHVRPLTTFATSSAAAAVAPSPAGPGVPPPIGSTISPGMFDPSTAAADDTAAGAGTEAEGKMPANLPDWSEIERGGPTSLPIYQIQRDLDFSMRKLVNIQVFEQLLEDPLGRHRFRDYLVSCGAQTAELDMWLDLQNHAKLYQQFQANADAIYGPFLPLHC